MSAPISTSVSAKELYNARAQNYDDPSTFHNKLTTDYLSYANPKPGFHCLDLATGTGLVAYKLAHAIRPNGSVTAIDLSPAMLSVAISKGDIPENLVVGSNIKFVEGDITDLDSVPELQGKEGTFDLITCASALVLLPDIPNAIKTWTKYLKPGGKFITDVPVPNAMLGNKILDKISGTLYLEDGHSMRKFRSNREWISDINSLGVVLEDGGLRVETLSETQDYEGIPARTKIKGLGGEGEGVWMVGEGGKLFDELLPLKKGEIGLIRREEARRAFEEEFVKYAGEDGMVREEFRFYIGVGVRI